MDGLKLIRHQDVQDNNISTVTAEVQEARVSPQQGHLNLKARLDAMEQKDAELKDAIDKAMANIQWKNSVPTHGDLATTYQNPQEGWTASVDEDNIVYRYDARAGRWEPISTNSLTTATDIANGLMSSADKIKLDALDSTQYVKRTGDTITGPLTVQGNITGNLTGNSSTTDKLRVPVLINGTEFDGSKNIDITLSGDDVTLDGYVKPTAGGAIDAGDSINDAIGKLEVNLGGKANSSHIHTVADVTTMTGYQKPQSGGAITDGDTLSGAIGKLEFDLDNKANSVHEHNYAGSDTAGGSANSAKRLENPIRVALEGHVIGEVSNFDGGNELVINTTIANPIKTELVRVTATHQVLTQSNKVNFTIPNFTPDTDIINVYLSGVRLEPTVEYEYTSTEITLKDSREFFVDDIVTIEVIQTK